MDKLKNVLIIIAVILIGIFVVNYETDKKEYTVNDYNIRKEEHAESQKYYIGNKNTRKFHLPSCQSLPSEKNRVKLESIEEAEKKGYSPCKRCEPEKR